MCATRGIFPAISIFTHGAVSCIHNYCSIVCEHVCKWRYLFIHSFGIIQIFCAQSNSDEDADADDDGNLANRFSAFTRTQSQNGHMVYFVVALMQSCSLFAFKENDVLWIEFNFNIAKRYWAISPHKCKYKLKLLVWFETIIAHLT